MKFNKKFYLVSAVKYEKLLETTETKKSEKSIESGNSVGGETKAEKTNSEVENPNQEIENPEKNQSIPTDSDLNKKQTNEAENSKKDSTYSQTFDLDRFQSSAFQKGDQRKSKEKDHKKRTFQFPPPGEPARKKKIIEPHGTKSLETKGIKKWQTFK